MQVLWVNSIKKFALLSIFIFSFFSTALFCQSAQTSLSAIDELIKQTDYDTALAELSDYMKKYPERLDMAQRRVDAIMKARSYYTKLASDLLDVMEKEPENAEKKLAIIKELESLEKHPTQEHLAFIKQAKAAAEFTYYRAQFRRIMEEGAKNARAQKYAEALDVIRGGFYMYRDEFYDENPPAVTNSVTSVVSELERTCQAYLSLRPQLNDALKAFVQAVESGNYQNSARAWQNFRAQMESFAAVRNRIALAGESLEKTFAELKKQNPELTEASYISFMTRFSLGISSEKDSGILGVLDCEWNYALGSSKTALANCVRKKFDEGIQSAPLQKAMETSFVLDLPRLSEADSFSSLALDVNGLDKLRTAKGGGDMGPGAPLYASSMRAAKNFAAGSRDSVDNLNDYKALNLRLGSIERPADVWENARSGSSYANELLSIIAALDKAQATARLALEKDWFLAYKNSLEAKGADGDGDGDKALDFTNISGFYQGVNSLVESSSVSAVAVAWKSLDEEAASLAAVVSSNYQNLYSDAESLLQNHYPDQAAQKVQDVQKNIASDKSLLAAARDRLLKSPSQESVSKINEAIASLDQWSAQGSGILAGARQEMLLAQSAQTQADEIYRRAARNYQNENFSAARNDLQRARELYNESLGHQESKALRTRSDKDLTDLGQRINDAENKIIVLEVRSLKTRAKNEYYAGNFESAENILNRAESRWAITNVEEDEEIKNLKLLVQNALSMKTGREIKPTAPLYPEMSQILSNARQYFDQGSKLISAGKRDEALVVLGEAKKKLQELQLVYPLNQEAALLTLRIDELLDPKQFNETFSRRVQAARQSAKVPATQQQGYSDLLDLAEIRPDYPGLKKIIYDVEIEIGVRQKPVDQSALRRSAALAQEAQRLYQGARGNEEILRSALSRLDQAIALNPNNESAITLKDRIQIAVGGKAAVVLSSADEASYNRAIQELRANNVIGAYTIVEQLLQTPANRRSSKILDLQKQVQARM